MDLVNVYKCLCDVQRLRVLNLLHPGPLCVCHLQELLDESQVKVSKQLGYMKKLGILSATREGTWMVYRLFSPPHPVLIENLCFLRDRIDEYPVFRDDLTRRELAIERIHERSSAGCPVPLLRCCCD